MPQGRTASDDLLKVELAANLLFEIYLFLSKFVLEFRDLAVGQRIFNGDRDLASYLSKELSIVLAERVLSSPRKT